MSTTIVPTAAPPVPTDPLEAICELVELKHTTLLRLAQARWWQVRARSALTVQLQHVTAALDRLRAA